MPIDKIMLQKTMRNRKNSLLWAIMVVFLSGATNHRNGLLSLVHAAKPKPPTFPPNEGNDFWNESFVFTTLAGKHHLSPFVKRLLLSRQELDRMVSVLRSKVHIEDMCIMGVLGWMLVPILRFLYNVIQSRLLLRSAITSHPRDMKESQEKTDHTKHLPSTSSVAPRSALFGSHPHESTPSFQSTYLFLASDHVQQISKIALLVYFMDVFRIIAVSMGFNMWQMQNFPHAFAQLSFAIWIAQRLAVGKKHLLRSYVSSHPETYGRIRVTDRLLNAAIIAGTALLVINILKIQMGVALNSFLAVGSVGTLALGLASQGIATQVLNGLMLASSDRIYEGDVVRFGNGLSGTIAQIGWMETIIRGSDEVMVSVPHTDLVKQQVSNLSRVRYSQVYQVLKFRLSDAEKMPEVIASIKDEIFNDCPTLITDGSRPFRVYWSDIQSDCLDVVVDAHFRLKILSDEYYDNRERVLMAIQRAVRQHGLYFAKEPKQPQLPQQKDALAKAMKAFKR